MDITWNEIKEKIPFINIIDIFLIASIFAS